MHEEETAERPVSSSQLFRRFLQCMEDGQIRRELSDDCILSFLGRCVKGAGPVSSYMRAQLVGRYNHMEFLDARQCNESEESALKERFRRSFQLLRSRFKQPEVLPTSMHLRAESDEEVEEEEETASASCVKQLVTPPRSSAPADGIELMQCITASGSLQASHKHSDGGIELSENCKMSLTLGYRGNTLGHKDDTSSDICLIVYEKVRLRTPAVQRHSRMRSARNVLTDDEGEVPAPRSVRRTLFSNTDDCDEDAVQPAIDDSSPLLLPRKRQHKGDSSARKTKRSNVLGGMRF
ncbi:PREDICTED: cell cycle negative regulator roughex [Drosophila arizonae]|uniref:Cell cycle negative regulator roughex n=1 Tax=Drosophila arizonae TaxID=7263 RepID=A0ABM1PXT3_DROAR|nr:PREDICTED: cell cycle negative regulator roughex [Drosophila arizonae]